MPYSMPEELLKNTSVVIGASATNTVVSEVINLSDEDSMCFNVDITAASVTAATGITAKIQDSADNSTWNDKKTVAISGNGVVSISLQENVAGDQTHLPLRPRLRIVVSTGAGDAVTISSVRPSRRRSR